MARWAASWPTFELGALGQVEREDDVVFAAGEQPGHDAGREALGCRSVEIGRFAQSDQQNAGGLQTLRRQKLDRLPRFAGKTGDGLGACQRSAGGAVGIGGGRGQLAAFGGADDKGAGPGNGGGCKANLHGKPLSNDRDA